MLNWLALVPPVMEYDSVCPVLASAEASVPITPFSANGGEYVEDDSVGAVGATFAVTPVARRR